MKTQFNHFLTLVALAFLLSLNCYGATFMIDPGHGGQDLGAKCGYAREKDVVLAVALKVKASLESQGHRVVLTRTGDYFVPLATRVAMNNKLKPDAFVSIHCNDTDGSKSAHGIEVYYLTPQSQALASNIHGSLVKGLKANDRGVRQRQLFVVHHTPHPSILAEIGFLSNAKERVKLCSADYQKRVAMAITTGLSNYKRAAVASAKLSAVKKTVIKTASIKTASARVSRALKQSKNKLSVR